MRDSFIIYRSFYEAICDLDADSQAQVFKAICEYSLNFKEIEMTGIAKTIFKLIKPQLDANNKRFENGSKPKNTQKESETQAKPKQKESESEANNNVNVNKNNNVNKNLNKNDNVIDISDKSENKQNFKNWSVEDFQEQIKINRLDYSDKELWSFFNYWSEKDQKGKMKFQLQKTWETSKRLITWFNNSDKFQPKNNIQVQKEQMHDAFKSATIKMRDQAAEKWAIK